MSAPSGWTAFDAAMRVYVEEFAALSAATEPELQTHPRWVRRYDKYVREKRPAYFPAQTVNHSAFYLKSFDALAAAFYESPLKPYLPGGAATNELVPNITIDPRTFSIRAAFRATKVGLDKTHIFDRETMEADIRSLHRLVESKTMQMELIGVILGAQVAEPIRLREDLCVSSLDESEIDAFLSPTPFPLTLNQSMLELEVLLPAPVALLRLSYEQPRDRPLEDHSAVLRAEFERFSDSVALHHDARPVLFMERQWIADGYLRGGWSTTAPKGIGLTEKSVVVTEVNSVVEACNALRKLALDETRSAVPLATRRLGLTRTRAFVEDVLIDTVISLEALLLKRRERKDLGHRLSVRAAHWAGVLGQDQPTVYDLAKRAYDLRSDLVHGQSPKREERFTIGGIEIGYDALVSRVADLGRRLGTDALRRVNDDGFGAHWDKLMRLPIGSPDDESGSGGSERG
jgi:Apea-like HEPN